MALRKVDFTKGVEALEKVNLEELNVLKEALVLEDESSAFNEDQMVNLEYGFLKAANATHAREAQTGAPVIANCAIAGGDDVEYTDGLPGIFLMHFRAKELTERVDGSDDKKAICGTPLMSFMKDDRAYVFGDTGYKYGACEKCVYGKFDLKAELKCLPNFRMLLLTVYPETDGTLKPFLIQFKGAGTRASGLKAEITKLVRNTKGKVLDHIIKITSKPEDEKSPDGKEIVVDKYVLNTVKVLPVSADRKAALLDIKTTILQYYGIQHIMRTHLYAQIAPTESLIADGTAAGESKQLENKEASAAGSKSKPAVL